MSIDKILKEFKCAVQHLDPPHIRCRWDVINLGHEEYAHVTINPQPGTKPWVHQCDCSWAKSRGAEPCWHVLRAFDHLRQEAPCKKKLFLVPGDHMDPCILYPEWARLAVHVRALKKAGTVPLPLELPTPAEDDIRLSQLPVGVPSGNFPKDHRGLRIRSPLEQAVLKRKVAEERRERLSADALSLSLSESQSAEEGCKSGSAGSPASLSTPPSSDDGKDAVSQAFSCGSEVPKGEDSAVVVGVSTASDEKGEVCAKMRRLSIASSTPVRARTSTLPLRVSARRKKAPRIWSPS